MDIDSLKSVEMVEGVCHVLTNLRQTRVVECLLGAMTKRHDAIIAAVDAFYFGGREPFQGKTADQLLPERNDLSLLFSARRFLAPNSRLRQDLMMFFYRYYEAMKVTFPRNAEIHARFPALQKNDNAFNPL